MRRSRLCRVRRQLELVLCWFDFFVSWNDEDRLVWEEMSVPVSMFPIS